MKVMLQFQAIIFKTYNSIFINNIQKYLGSVKTKVNYIKIFKTLQS